MAAQQHNQEQKAIISAVMNKNVDSSKKKYYQQKVANDFHKRKYVKRKIPDDPEAQYLLQFEMNQYTENMQANVMNQGQKKQQANSHKIKGGKNRDSDPEG